MLANARPVEVETGAVKTLPSNMTLRYQKMHVMDGSLWGVIGEWTLPVVTVTTNRYSPWTYVCAGTGGITLVLLVTQEAEDWYVLGFMYFL